MFSLQKTLVTNSLPLVLARDTWLAHDQARQIPVPTLSVNPLISPRACCRIILQGARSLDHAHQSRVVDIQKGQAMVPRLPGRSCPDGASGRPRPGAGAGGERDRCLPCSSSGSWGPEHSASICPTGGLSSSLSSNTDATALLPACLPGPWPQREAGGEASTVDKALEAEGRSCAGNACGDTDSPVAVLPRLCLHISLPSKLRGPILNTQILHSVWVWTNAQSGCKLSVLPARSLPGHPESWGSFLPFPIGPGLGHTAAWVGSLSEGRSSVTDVTRVLGTVKSPQPSPTGPPA